MARRTEIDAAREFMQKRHQQMHGKGAPMPHGKVMTSVGAVAKGQAMPGGRYPIRNRSDLENAIRAVGRSKTPAATRAWIKKRAAQLGLTSLVPADW